MLKYHVAVCDDEKSDLDGIVQSVQQYDVQGCFDIETYMDGNELLSELQMQKKSFDLLLLDIEMPSNGFQLAQSLIQMEKHPLVVFVTKRHEYAVQGYGIAFRYLVKPLDQTLFAAAMDAVLQELNSKHFTIEYDGVTMSLETSDIYFLESHGHIQMITEKNNMHDFDTSMFFRWIFKSAFAILIVSNTWNIVMGVFDATQSVVNQSSGVIIGETSIHFDRLIPGLEFQLESMTIGSLLSLWFQTLVVGLTMNILSICIFLVTYGRMIEIYVVTALGPIPLATMGSSEWRSTGQNYLKSLLALGFQAFLIMIVVGIYAVLIRNISGAADIAGAIWGCMGYTVLLCFCLFKTGSISKSVFGAH